MEELHILNEEKWMKESKQRTSYELCKIKTGSTFYILQTQDNTLFNKRQN